ncbi:MAG: hypothetical protein K2M95_04600 [Clostridiales bacterium]|nr:hypothetical protein [Clostridiales bacterium]
MKYIETITNTDRFCLHDSTVSKMEFIDHNLELTFSEGFWETNEVGKLIRQRKHCKMIIKFLITEDEELNLFIFKETAKRRKEIDFAAFSDLIHKNGFRIYREFRCGFSQQLILEGNTDKGNYSIMTQEVDEIIYQCEDGD